MAATDPFKGASNYTSPPRNAEIVTPSDANELAHVTRAISLSSEGDLAVVMADGDALTIPSGHLAAGVLHPMQVKQVKDTGTASGLSIIAWW